MMTLMVVPESSRPSVFVRPSMFGGYEERQEFRADDIEDFYSSASDSLFVRRDSNKLFNQVLV